MAKRSPFLLYLRIILLIILVNLFLGRGGNSAVSEQVVIYGRMLFLPCVHGFQKLYIHSEFAQSLVELGAAAVVFYFLVDVVVYGGYDIFVKLQIVIIEKVLPDKIIFDLLVEHLGKVFGI